MKRLVGYVVSIAGILIMALGFGIVKIKLKFLEGVAGNYIAGAGIAAVVVGVFLSLNNKGGRRRRQAIAEVPIYEGVGKKRRIVGYQKN